MAEPATSTDVFNSIIDMYSTTQRHRVEDLQNTRQQCRRCLRQQPVGADEHGVARQNRHVAAPAGVDRRFAAAHGGIVHDVVVQQREVVEYLDGGGGGQRDVDVVGKQPARQQQQHRAQALAAARERIADRIVEPFGFGRQLTLSEIIFEKVEKLFVGLHFSYV